MESTKNWTNILSGCHILAALSGHGRDDTSKEVRMRAGIMVRDSIRNELVEEMAIPPDVASEIIDTVVGRQEEIDKNLADPNLVHR
jgi:hypothetical protein